MAPSAPAAERLREAVRRFAREFAANDLLTYASAISFQIIVAIVPFLLFGFGVLGFLDLEDVWRRELAPELEAAVSATAFAFIDDTVRKVLEQRQAFWVSAGLLIALWQVSGTVRAVMGALNDTYGVEEERSWWRRLALSLALGLAVGACWLGAIAVVVLSPLLLGEVPGWLVPVLFVLRWAAAGLLLLLSVGLLLHFGPERGQSLHWVTAGSLLIIVGWILMSLGFGFYVREIAAYNSIFGGLATVVVLTAYLYASAIVFLGGVQLDALRSRQDAAS